MKLHKEKNSTTPATYRLKKVIIKKEQKSRS